MEKLGGAGVDVEVEFEAQAEENVSGVLVGGDAGIAERTKEDGIEFVAEHFDGSFGEGDFFAEEFVGAPVEFHELDVVMAAGGGGFDNVDGDGRDFFADAVTGDDSDARVRTAFAKGDIGHECASGDLAQRGTLAREARMR